MNLDVKRIKRADRKPKRVPKDITQVTRNMRKKLVEDFVEWTDSDAPWFAFTKSYYTAEELDEIRDEATTKGYTFADEAAELVIMDSA